MDAIAATCPSCHVKHYYGSELAGRYTLCLNCRTRFYVEVPTLAEFEGARPLPEPRVDRAPNPDTTLDDLLWDTQQGSRYIIQSLRRQEGRARLDRGLLILAILLGLVNLAGVAFLLTRP